MAARRPFSVIQYIFFKAGGPVKQAARARFSGGMFFSPSQGEIVQLYKVEQALSAGIWFSRGGARYWGTFVVCLLVSSLWSLHIGKNIIVTATGTGAAPQLSC